MSDGDLIESDDTVTDGDTVEGGNDTATGGNDTISGNDTGQGGDDTLDGGAAGDLLSDDGDTGESDSQTSYELDVPEELQAVAYSDEALDAFKAFASEQGLSQEQFQALAEFDMRNSMAANEKAVDDWNNRVKGWKEDVLSDPDIGGDKFSETKANVKGLLSKYGDKEFNALLLSPSETNPEGLAIGNHPAVMKFLNRIGKALADPEFEDGSAATSDGDTLKKMYPSMYKDDK